MSLYEPRTHAELKAHYHAVHDRLWNVPPRPEPLPMPCLDVLDFELPPIPTKVEEVADRWRDIDTRLFGKRVSPKAVIYITAAYFKIDVAAITGRCRKRTSTRPRHIAMFLIRNFCLTCFAGKWVQMSGHRISQHFNQDHATTFHDIRAVIKRMEKDERYANAVSDITALLWR